jgi:pyruvate,water dikinase
MIPELMSKEIEFGQIPFHLLSEEIPPPKDLLQGIAASPGIVEGVCVVLSKFEDMQEIKEGLILIAETAGPKLSPIIPKIKGLLTEKGGLLAMASRAAREYAVPAVVGIEGLRQRLHTGDRVLVDGLEGKVYLLVPASEELGRQ